MQPRLTADLILPVGSDEAAAAAFTQLVALAQELRAGLIDGSSIERSRVTFHACHHGDSPEAACEPIDSWEAG